MRNRVNTGILTIFFLYLAMSQVRAQVNDAGFWTNITVEKEIFKDLDLVLTEEVRFYENITEVGSYFTDFGAEYKIAKGLKAGVFYRFINKRRLDNSYSRNQRIYADITYRYKIKRFELGYRARVQVQYNGYNTREIGHVPEWYFRQKVHFGYNTKSRFDPYLDGELWYRADPEWSRFDNVRISAGVVTKITKKQFIDTGYLVNMEFNTVNPYTYYVVFIGYKIIL